MSKSIEQRIKDFIWTCPNKTIDIRELLDRKTEYCLLETISDGDIILWIHILLDYGEITLMPDRRIRINE